jgi:hypothetical protein
MSITLNRPGFAEAPTYKKMELFSGNQNYSPELRERAISMVYEQREH